MSNALTHDMGISVVVSHTSLMGLLSGSPANAEHADPATVYGATVESVTTMVWPRAQHWKLRRAVCRRTSCPLCSFVTTACPVHCESVLSGNVTSCTCAVEPAGTYMSPPKELHADCWPAAGASSCEEQASNHIARKALPSSRLGGIAPTRRRHARDAGLLIEKAKCQQ